MRIMILSLENALGVSTWCEKEVQSLLNNKKYLKDRNEEEILAKKQHGENMRSLFF